MTRRRLSPTAVWKLSTRNWSMISLLWPKLPASSPPSPRTTRWGGVPGEGLYLVRGGGEGWGERGDTNTITRVMVISTPKYLCMEPPVRVLFSCSFICLEKYNVLFYMVNIFIFIALVVRMAENAASNFKPPILLYSGNFFPGYSCIPSFFCPKPWNFKWNCRK